MVSKSIIEIINELISKEYKPIDMSCNRKCSKCGECCSNFLPVTQKEVDIIQKYVIENNIKPQKNMLVMEQKMMCPYFSGKECLIYEVRPKICKMFYCYKNPTIKEGQEFVKEEHIPVNMWEIAEFIEKQRKDINK